MRTLIRRRVSRIGESALTLARTGYAKSAASTADWSNRLQEEAAAPEQSGTRWGRGLGIIGGTGIVVGLLGYSIAGGAVAASFNVADQPLTAHIESVDGVGLAAVMSAVKSKNPDGTTEAVGTLHAAISSGTIRGVCMIAHETVMGVGYSIVIEAAQTSTATGQDIIADATEATGFNVTAADLVVGRSADEISLNGRSLNGQPGGLGIDGPDATVHMENVTATAYGAELLGAVKASDFTAKVVPGEATSC